MKVCGQTLSKQNLEQIQHFVDTSNHISRRALSRSLCETFKWRSNNGQLKDGSCRKALAKLHREGLLHLPVVEQPVSFARDQNADIDISVPQINCTLEDLGKIEVIPITNRKSYDAKVWKALVNQYHYLGNPKACGAQIRYLIKSPLHGFLGAISFSSAIYALRDRDKHIGWSDSARIANLRYLVSNNRFLILPTVNVKNLASHALVLCLKQLQNDWVERYNIRPVLAETFVDSNRFTGTCYKASNWTRVGTSSGRRDGIRKDIYLLPLTALWQELLCQEPNGNLCDIQPSQPPENWMEEEFGTCRLEDQRLKDRLYLIADNFYNRPIANIPQACETYASTKGSYRFFSNKKINMDVILTPHIESTIRRIQNYSVILAPQDTTTINYSHPATHGLGPINNNDNTSVGMMLHDTLAFTTDGVPLGVLDAQCWARDPKDKNKSDRRKNVPTEQKESCKWLRSFQKLAQIQKLCPDTTLISIGDRESDMYDLFLEAHKDPNGPKLLVRSVKGRSRRLEIIENTGEEHPQLWAHMQTLPKQGIITIHIPKRENKTARSANLQVRFSQVTLIAPKKSNHNEKIQVWAVYLSEETSNNEKIEWLLLTTAPVRTLEDAKERVEWYTGRWGIEVYHRTLKSGCRIKDRQLGTADSLQACLGVDMVVAWRIYHLTMLGRQVPDHPCTAFFEDVEWKALYCYAKKTKVPPANPPTMKEAILLLGKIGGHLGRTGDGMPGIECVWRGIQVLDIATDMYVLFTGAGPPEIRKSYTNAMNGISSP